MICICSLYGKKNICSWHRTSLIVKVMIDLFFKMIIISINAIILTVTVTFNGSKCVWNAILVSRFLCASLIALHHFQPLRNCGNRIALNQNIVEIVHKQNPALRITLPYVPKIHGISCCMNRSRWHWQRGRVFPDSSQTAHLQLHLQKRTVCLNLV